MGKKIRTEEVDHLFEAILCLKDKEECYTFFEDVCTINELLSLSQRFEVAKMLTDKRTYLDISEKTGASTATISRVNRSLNYGNDGYEMVFFQNERKGSSERKFRKNRIILRLKRAENTGFTASLLFSYEGVSGDLDSEVIYWYMSAEIFFVFSLASEEFFILLDKTQNT